LHPGTALAVFLQGLAGQKMLEKIHAAVTHIGGNHPGGHLITVLTTAFNAAPQAHGTGIAERFRVGVGAYQISVFIGLVAFDKPGGFLIEVDRSQATGNRQRVILVAVAQAQLLLVDPRVIAITAVVAVGKGQCQILATASQLDAPVVVGAGFQPQAPALAKAGRFNHIDHPVQGVGAVQGIAGAANNFNAPGLLAVGLEQFIDVAKPRRAQGNAVFRQQKTAAGTGARQYRGADGGQVFLAVVAVHAHPRQARQGLLDMDMGCHLQGFAIERRAIAHQAGGGFRHPGGGDNHLIQLLCGLLPLGCNRERGGSAE